MHNRELILEILEQIYGSIQKVIKRFEPIKKIKQELQDIKI